MDEHSNGSGGTGNTPGGSGEENQDNNIPDVVSRKAYEKLLKEKKTVSETLKNVNARLAELESEREDRSTKDAEAKGEFQKVIDAERKKAEAALKQVQELQGKISDYDSRELGRRKFGAIYDALGGAVDKKFFPLIDLDQVELDDEGNVSAESVEKYANALREQYPEIITTKKGGLPPGKLPGNGKGSNGKRITKSEWEALGVDEMKKYKYADIDWTR